MLSIEFFLCDKPSGPSIMLSAPVRSGLKQADTLRVSGLSILVLGQRTILPIDLPDITDEIRQRLEAHARSGQRLAVAEFNVRGLVDSYFLSLDIAHSPRP